MKHRFTVPGIVLLLTIVCLVLIYFVESPIEHVILGLCLMTVFWGYVRYISKQAADERKQLLESVQRIATATLGHHRHDWMNDLQILYGYIQLGKIDKLSDCVGRIKERMAEESKISRLGIPSLTFYLQSFREVNRTVQLEVEIIDDLQLGSLLCTDEAEELTEAIIETVRAYQFIGRSSWNDILQLKMSIQCDDREVFVRFEQMNAQGNVERLKQHIDNWISGKKVRAEQLDSKLSVLRLRMPIGNL